jgi:hypothetical protein
MWPHTLAAYLPDRAAMQLSRTSPSYHQQLLPQLRRRWRRRHAERLDRFLRQRALRYPIQEQLQRCVVSACPYPRAFVLDMSVSSPYIQARPGCYCWKHQPDAWI